MGGGVGVVGVGTLCGISKVNIMNKPLVIRNRQP